MATTEQKHLAAQVAVRLGRAHTELVFANIAAKTAKLPRAARLDKMAADAAMLRDYYDKLSNGKKV